MTTTAPLLRAEGLTLRPWRLSDAPALTAVCRTSDLSAVSIDVTTEADATRWLTSQHEAWTAGTRLAFAILTEPGTATDSGNGDLAGHAVLTRPDPASPVAGVGYWTAGSHRGRGVASRAVTALARWAFETYPPTALTHLDLYHRLGNTASCRVADRAGFTFEGEVPPGPSYPRPGHLHQLRRS
ncbi:GNAT family N-acetyltransferase [Streptomyces sp. NPDC051561]|uniref:GNAT family N-acetyltransferase n=1 Tax=Streptomyces sp. NPDC051561 TaxID=3365658 RepID=UPI00378CE12E